MNTTCSTVNLLSFLITIFWLLNISFKLFRGQDLLERPTDLLVPKLFTALITGLLLLRYAMNSQFANNYSKLNSNNLVLNYLNLITKTDFSTLVLNGLYFIIMTVYISARGSNQVRAPTRIDLTESNFNLKRSDQLRPQRNTHPQPKKPKSKFYKQNTDEVARVKSEYLSKEKKACSGIISNLNSPNQFNPSNGSERSLSQRLEIYIAEETNSNLSSQKSNHLEFIREESLQPAFSQFKGSDCASHENSFIGSHSSNRWKAEDFSDRWLRKSKNFISIAVALFETFSEKHLLECFAVAVILSSILLRNLAGLLLVLLLLVGLIAGHLHFEQPADQLLELEGHLPDFRDLRVPQQRLPVLFAPLRARRRRLQGALLRGHHPHRALAARAAPGALGHDRALSLRISALRVALGAE